MKKTLFLLLPLEPLWSACSNDENLDADERK